MKDEPRLPAHGRHQLDHAVPTVIHHPEEDMPLLARWLDRAMANRTRFWSLLGGLVVVVVGLAVLANGLEMGKTVSDEAWTKLEAAKTPGERVELAQEFPGTEAERWALLQAATEYYNQGLADLPANRDAALPILGKALDLFGRVARESPPEAPQTRAASFGMAQTYEARNEIDKAVAQYDRVVKTWKGTEEAEHADAKARALRKPENIDFYKQLYAYKPIEMTLPPGGRMGIPLPPNHPPIGGASIAPSRAPSLIPPLPPVFDETRPKASGEMPDDVLAPRPAAAPAVKPTPETDFPDDVLAPEPGKPSPPKP